MSCQCSTCGYTIAQPDSIWYITTSRSILSDFLCGTCVAAIPMGARVATDTLWPDRLTVGPYSASANGSGNYQCFSLRQMAPWFWVSLEAFEETFGSHNEILRDHLPQVAPARFLRELVAAMRAGLEVPRLYEGRRTRHELVMNFCSDLETFLSLPHPPPLFTDGKVRITVYGPNNPKPPPSPEELQRVATILEAASRWADGGAP